VLQAVHPVATISDFRFEESSFEPIVNCGFSGSHAQVEDYSGIETEREFTKLASRAGAGASSALSDLQAFNQTKRGILV
jgi:hypothetical protein